MDRNIPVFNRYLSQKWILKNFELHQNKIKLAKPRVETKNKSNPIYKQLINSHSKKRYNLNSCLSGIDKENQRILGKISKIIFTSNPRKTLPNLQFSKLNRAKKS